MRHEIIPLIREGHRAHITTVYRDLVGHAGCGGIGERTLERVAAEIYSLP